MDPFYKAFNLFSDLSFIETKNESFSYKDFFKKIKAHAFFLQKNEKLQDQKLIAVFRDNDQDYLLTIFSLWYLGKTPILLSKDHEGQLQQLKRECPFSIILKDPIKDHHFHKKTNNFQAASFPEKGLVVLTSGSSGPPKAIVHSLDSITHSAMGSIQFYQMKEKNLFPLTLSLSHIGGFMIALRAFFSGGTLILKETHWTDCLSEKLLEKTSFVSLVPKQLKDILDNPKLLKRLQKSKAIIMGGAPTSKKLFNEALSQSLKISLSYGQTETCAQVIASSPGGKYFFLGDPLPFRSLKILSDASIQIRGKVLYLGEYKNGVFNKRTEESYQTQDFALYDKNKKITAIKRKDDMIISGGKKISPKEIIDYAYQNLEMTDIEVYKTYHPKWGETPIIALEQGSQGVSQHSSLIALFQGLPSYKRPSTVYSTQNFPRRGIKTNVQELKKQVLLKHVQEHFPFSFQYQKFNHTNEQSPLLLFFHGFMGQKEDHFFNKTFSLGFDILSIDLPGHGKTAISHLDHFEKTVREMAQLIDTLSSLKLVLYGYSMGGRLLLSSLSYVEKTPENHLYIFESAHTGLSSIKEKKERLAQDKALSEKISKIKNVQDYKLFLESWYSAEIFRNIKNSPQYQLLIEKKLTQFSLLQMDNFSKALSIFSLGHQTNTLEKLKELQNIHFIAGLDDQKFSTLYLKNKIKNTHLLRNTSHNCHLQAPDQIIEIIKKNHSKVDSEGRHS